MKFLIEVHLKTKRLLCYKDSMELRSILFGRCHIPVAGEAFNVKMKRKCYVVIDVWWWWSLGACYSRKVV
jgi:hypothetical protein